MGLIELPQLVFWILMLVIVPVMAFLILRTVLKKPPYKFKMVFMTPGIDDHVTEYGKKLDLSMKVGTKTYTIKAERIYKLKPGRMKKLWNRFRGIKQSFITVYQHKKTSPLAPVSVAVSARILKEVSESRALDKALRSEFKVPWDMKKILMVIGFLVVAVVVYVVISGGAVI